MDFRNGWCRYSYWFICLWQKNYLCDWRKISKITPSRGVAIELSSALVIITGSRLKIPLSTTICQVGATVGVGALENPKTCGGINCKVFLKTAIGWVITCIIVGLTTALLVAQGAYAPTKFNYCPVVNSTV